jgi:hypothetical protein
MCTYYLYVCTYVRKYVCTNVRICMYERMRGGLERAHVLVSDFLDDLYENWPTPAPRAR